MDQNNSDRNLMKVMNIMILVVLLVVTGLLVSLHIKLNQSVSPEGPPGAAPRPAVPSPPAANPVIPPTESPQPARTQPPPSPVGRLARCRYLDDGPVQKFDKLP